MIIIISLYNYTLEHMRQCGDVLIYLTGNNSLTIIYSPMTLILS